MNMNVYNTRFLMLHFIYFRYRETRILNGSFEEKQKALPKLRTMPLVVAAVYIQIPNTYNKL